jgi:hypothetical protein
VPPLAWAGSGHASSAVENPARAHYVVLELVHKGFDTIETALTTQEFGKRHAARLTVEIPVEIDQVCLEKGVLGVEVKRRSPSDIDRTRVTRPVGALEPARVDSVRGPGAVLCNGDVRSREPQGPPTLFTVDNLTTHLIGSAQHPGRVGHIASPQGAADRRRRDRLNSEWHFPDRVDTDHIQAMLRPLLLKKRKVAFTAVSEVQVVTDYEYLGTYLTDENSLGELEGCSLRNHLVEVDEERNVDTALANQIKAIIKGGEEKRSALRSENLGRVPDERDHRCRNPALSGLSHRSAQYLLMAEVDTVESSQDHSDRNIM